MEDILSQAPLRDVPRQRSCNRDSGDGQRLWDYGTTERFFNAVSALCVAEARFDPQVNRVQDRQLPLAKAANLYVLIRGQRWIVIRRRSGTFSHR